MPDPNTEFLDMLKKTCIKVDNSEQLSPEELADWMKEGAQRNSQFTSDCVKFLLRARLIEQENNGILRLPELMSRWIETKDNNIPIALIHRHIRFIGEMLAELKEPKTVIDLLNVAVKKYKFDWGQNQQVKRRCSWLMSAGLIMPEDGSNRMRNSTPLRLTPSGSDLLHQLDIYIPRFGGDASSNLLPEEVEAPEQYKEGATRTVTINAYERNVDARKQCIRHHGYKCSVCSFDFESTYGPIGKNYIHVHHRVPLAEIGTEYEINPLEDLVPICPNCHAMIHKTRDTLTIEQLKQCFTGINRNS
ncbi:MAG: HNH endonuclease [Gammaproteobacteria bacterium]|nr:HNH endonuclease [Gammaproteobacteria bacterium]